MPLLALITLLSCDDAGPDSLPAVAPPVQATAGSQPRPKATTTDLDQGQQHPPLPANSPAWERDVQRFVAEYRWYGEHSWADVRMRVAGHLSAAGRDRARLAAQDGDLMEAAAHYRSLAALLRSIPAPPDGVSGQINALLLRAAERDADLLLALASGEAPAADGAGLASIRAAVLGLALRHREGENVADEAAALQEALGPHLDPRTDLDLDAFTDFHARHALRLRLFEAYLDSLDPMGISERWGYWEAREVARQARLLGMALAAMGGEPFSQGGLVGTPPPLEGDPLRWPSLLADALIDPDQQVSFTADGIGALPTGDTLIDTAGHPGPRAIGTLQRLGMEDPVHRAWLEETAQRLSALEDPDAIVVEVRARVAVLDAYDHGSRFYNIKQLRNAAVRQLARAGAEEQAMLVLGDQWPLHHQDWACPNRAGILHAVEGRLLAEAGDPTAGMVLEQAIQEGRDFLALVDGAAQHPGPAGRANGGGPARPGGRGGPGADPAWSGRSR